ncbi:MarR family transcriptional regulator [Pyruvatibacter sp.]|uniref:MarR family winged helix-turn-helix transcriptional regulator n=1 Tax=Pyruvatibacter sp. TaxID=1981328 RepID=UPI0032EB9C77
MAKGDGDKKKTAKGSKKLVKAASPAKNMGRRDLSLAVMNSVPWLYFRLQAQSQNLGTENAQRGGAWGILNSVITQGPQTVPQLARARPVSRQHIQKLANEMAADGLIQFVANPAHRRSQLIEATPKGLDAYARMNASLGELADALGKDFSKEELFVAASVIERMRAKLADTQGGGGAPGALPLPLAAE